jgi:hypothetical protein
MPNMFNEQTLAAGGSVASTILGNAYEFARARAVISVGLAAAATGTFCAVQLGARNVATEFSPPILTRYPVIPDEMYVNDVVDVNDRILIPWRNPSGGGIVVRTVIQLSA